MAALQTFDVTGHGVWKLLFSSLLPILNMSHLTRLQSLGISALIYLANTIFVGHLWLQGTKVHSRERTRQLEF